MTKNQILSYVLKTPENTNPQILMSMLKILLFASMAANIKWPKAKNKLSF